jgi:hypothetical protein
MIKWIELEDQPWFPSYFRTMQTDFIGWLVHLVGLYQPVAIIVENALGKLKEKSIVDLCSGNGLAIVSAIKDVPEDKLTVVYLSDKYPSFTVPENVRVKWMAGPVDVLKPETLPAGLRTIFNAYHHFSEDQAWVLLDENAKEGLLICEILEPTFFNLIKIFFTTTIVQFLTCFFVKPFRLDRIFFTCILPVNLITVTWDGIVSVLKSRRAIDIEKSLIDHLGKEYNVTCGSYRKMLTKVNWFLISPVQIR